MAWIFVTAVFLVLVFLLVRYPAFQRGLLFALVGGAALGAVGGGIIYFNNQQQEQQEQRSKTLIKATDLKLEELTLTPASSSLWDLKGNVTNLSRHHLREVTLKVEVQNCPDTCVVVGEYEPRLGTEVPPQQMRAFKEYVILRDLPELKNWRWNYRIREIRAKPD